MSSSLARPSRFFLDQLRSFGSGCSRCIRAQVCHFVASPNVFWPIRGSLLCACAISAFATAPNAFHCSSSIALKWLRTVRSSGSQSPKPHSRQRPEADQRWQNDCTDVSRDTT